MAGREQTCRPACRPFTPGDLPADTNVVVATRVPAVLPWPRTASSSLSGPAASWCFHEWPENRLSCWEAVRMCISCILSFTLETQ